MVRIEKLTEQRVTLGEAPHWDVESQSLYFVDVIGMAVYQYHAATKRVSRASVGLNLVSFIIPVEGGRHQFVVSLGREVVRIFWNSETEDVRVIERIAEVENNLIDNRFNDGKCDPSGRLWAGTFSTTAESPLVYPEKGALYSVTSERRVVKHVEKLRLSNGIAFNSKLKRMYFVDSCKGTVDEFDFGVTLGTIANRRAIFTLSEHNIDGIADGMTIDTDGNLWVAIFNGGRIIQIDPKKPETLLQTIIMPVKQITSLTFGGQNLDELYVTTGAYKITSEEDLSAPENGALFRITGMKAKGLAANNFRLVNM